MCGFIQRQNMLKLVGFTLTLAVVGEVRSSPKLSPYLKYSSENCYVSFATAIDQLKTHPNFPSIKEASNTAKVEALESENANNLDSDQLKAIYFYTMENNDFRYLLNDKLKNKNGTGIFQQYITLLLSALNVIGVKYPEGDVTWRGIPKRKDLTVNTNTTWLDFTSSFVSKALAKNISSSNGTLFRILNSVGYDIGKYSTMPKQGELLITPNTDLHVMELANVTEGGITYREYTVKLMVLGPDMQLLPCPNPTGTTSGGMSTFHVVFGWICCVFLLVCEVLTD